MLLRLKVYIDELLIILNFMNKIREDFPFFNQKDCVTFLDSAASSQKPKCVIDKIVFLRGKRSGEVKEEEKK